MTPSAMIAADDTQSSVARSNRKSSEMWNRSRSFNQWRRKTEVSLVFVNSKQSHLRVWRWIVAGWLGVQAVWLMGQPVSPAVNPGAGAVKPVGEGLFEMGEVRLDKNKRTVSFPAYVNQTNVLSEYAVVGAAGKLHESVLATKAEPYHIHVAMLLLGATNRTAKAESGPPLAGEAIRIWVAWNHEGKEQRVPMEDLVLKGEENQPKAPMARGIWIYNGSRVMDGTFLAQRDESIVAIMDDIDALVNNPRKGRENDELWYANPKLLPPLQTPVHVTFELAQPK